MWRMAVPAALAILVLVGSPALAAAPTGIHRAIARVVYRESGVNFWIMTATLSELFCYGDGRVCNAWLVAGVPTPWGPLGIQVEQTTFTIYMYGNGTWKGEVD
jgi:hypothetical protein